MKSQLVRPQPEEYEKPAIRRHAVVMTMAPAGCKMGHGLFPFVTKKPEERREPASPPPEFAYRRN